MEGSNSEARLDIFTDNNYNNDGEPVLAGNITVSGTAGQSDGQGEKNLNRVGESLEEKKL